MLNPILSNAIIQFGNGFFPEQLTEKYDTYLYRVNYPLKTFRGYFHETIQSLSIPGLALQTTEMVGLYVPTEGGLRGSLLHAVPVP